MKFEFDINEQRNYSARILYDLRIIFPIAILFAIIVAVTNNIWWGISVGTIFLFVKFFQARKEANISITKIIFEDESFTINYFKKDERKTVNGLIKELKVEKKQTQFYQFASLFLKFTYQIEIINQYQTGEWTEDLMKEFYLKYEEFSS